MDKDRLPKDPRVPAFVRRALGRLRRGRRAWSPEKDRDFHDDLFGRQDFDPFGFRYPGYITIRRFADLASPFLDGLRSVLDVGCGPAEVTCELARRLPGVIFHGVDHSPAGIDRARRHAGTLGLNNATFEVADAERYVPARPFDIVTMFDAFHHLDDPGRFVRRMREISSRFLLVEPRGDWKGSWRKDLDFDWLLLDLDKIRARVDALTGERKVPPRRADSAANESTRPPDPVGSPVEHRYTLDDFRGFFEGFGLRLRGTVSGLDAYLPVQPLRRVRAASASSSWPTISMPRSTNGWASAISTSSPSTGSSMPKGGSRRRPWRCRRPSPESTGRTPSRVPTTWNTESTRASGRRAPAPASAAASGSETRAGASGRACPPTGRIT